MKIAYLGIWDVYTPSGVCNKIAMQMEGMERLGHNVAGFFVSPAGVKPLVPVQAVEHCSSAKGYALVLQRARAVQSLAPELAAWSPDLIYFRHCVYVPGLASLLKPYPYISEINSCELKEFRNTRSALAYQYVKYTRRRLTVPARLLNCVSPEIEQSERADGRRSTHVMANGIIADALPFYDSSSNGGPVVGFIGSPGYPWHGVDEICLLAGLAQMQGFQFHIIGVPAEEVSLDGRLPDNVIFKGFLSGDALEQAYREMDVALDTVSLHRKQMDETSSLKLREYLARGIPVILPHKDPDIRGDHPFVLPLPNCPGNLVDNSQQVSDFIELARSNAELRRLAHEFACLELDLVEKFRQMFVHLEGVDA